jgi:ribosomal protein S18 acetylase RimI-like enzyme
MMIRPAKQSDVDALYALAANVPEFKVSDTTVSFWPKAILAAAIDAPDVYLFVATEANELAGFVLANANASLRKLTIENIYVVPAARGSQIGDQLLAAVIDAAKQGGYEYVATLIPPTAKGAAQLYERAGFATGETFVWLDKPLTQEFTA